MQNKADVVKDCEWRRERTDIIFYAVEIHAILHADARIVLRQNRGRNADMTNTTMRGRGDQPDRVQDGAAAYGDDIGMTVDVIIEQFLLYGFDEVQFGLDLLPARNRYGIGNQIESASVIRRIGL